MPQQAGNATAMPTSKELLKMKEECGAVAVAKPLLSIDLTFDRTCLGNTTYGPTTAFRWLTHTTTTASEEDNGVATSRAKSK
eukprot:CAMPEP_0181101110 /NCGR_PEP_ID=MMETSP1071-20121207/13572_1 /TAXON_ID=35127 /ORGANISM="Thalassiosira sp., Strain NH16" /LENGTH=81 /DNA_ID=CAMNT_0023183925 /DNA_START=508 /DNA_END=754 /DNA_ORIENTATION=+